MPLRHVVGAGFVAMLMGLPAPARAIDGAELELVGSAIGRADGAPATFGYEPPGSPDLVFDGDAEVPLGPHADHDDARFDRDRLYRNGERVNEGRSRGSGGTARGEIEAGHSIAVMSGWADAGSNELGGSAEAHTGTLGASTGSALASMRVEKRITILPGTSGLATGALVTGLRWEFDGHGSLDVEGRTHPNASHGAASSDLSVTLLRGSTGTCGAFDCPNGALAVAARLLTGLSFQAANPEATGGRTGFAMRNRSWSASYNAGTRKAGEVFDSGSDDEEVGLPITAEDELVSRVESVDTSGAPLHLDAIEFEANVGETLRVEMQLVVSGSVDGRGAGHADFFDSFDGRVVDPQARGLVFESSVPVPEPGRAELARAALLAMALGARHMRARR
jgi:hypothetical protein